MPDSESGSPRGNERDEEMAIDVGQYDALALADLVRRKEIKPIELVDAAIERIERVNPELNCVMFKNYDAARESASGPLPDGPFIGVPLLLKDLGISYEGLPLTGGCRYLQDVVAEEDSVIAERIAEGGFIRLAKTVTPELGYCAASEPPIYPPARNPWNRDHTPGGSSGGSGAAVAARVVPLATASDGGGSTRIPASNNGLVGLKQSRGGTTLAPLQAAPWYGCVVDGCVSLSVRDQAAYHDLTQYSTPGDVYSLPRPELPFLDEVGRDPGRLRIAIITKAANGKPVHPDCVEGAHNAAELCSSLGHDVEEAEYSFDFDSLSEVFSRMACAATAGLLRDTTRRVGRAPRQDELGNVIQEMVERGEQMSAAALVDDIEAMHAFGWTIAKDCLPYDVVITPTMPNPPHRVGYYDMTLSFDHYQFELLIPEIVFTLPHNVSGLPAMSLPLHWSTEGLPCGVQFIAKHANDSLLFRLAAQIERAQPWSDKVPPIHA